MRKLIKNSVITVLITIIVLIIFPTTAFATDYEPRLSAPSGEPYYTRKLNKYAQTGYGMPNCVAYAYGRVYEMNDEAPLISRGNAGEWWFINKANNYYDYGKEAKLGAVACWSNHVAVVEEIDDNGAVTLSESHWGGTYFNTVKYTNMSSHYGQAFYGYIYTYKEGTPMQSEEDKPAYKMEDTYFELQEKNCFTALEFNMSNNEITNPVNNILLNA
ncbi:MAG: CHAP domain-containing protein [Clostridium sp.]|nr:CHAP domain-containing protein [Clostridium sp.]